MADRFHLRFDCGHVPKDRFQASDAVGVHGGHVCGVCICSGNLHREHRQHLDPIGRPAGHGDGIVVLCCLQRFHLSIEVIVDLRHRSGDRHNARFPALVGKKNTKGGCNNSRHKDHRQKQNQHYCTAA